MILSQKKGRDVPHIRLTGWKQVFLTLVFMGHPLFANPYLDHCLAWLIQHDLTSTTTLSSQVTLEDAHSGLQRLMTSLPHAMIVLGGKLKKEAEFVLEEGASFDTLLAFKGQEARVGFMVESLKRTSTSMEVGLQIYLYEQKIALRIFFLASGEKGPVELTTRIESLASLMQGSKVGRVSQFVASNLYQWVTFNFTGALRSIFNGVEGIRYIQRVQAIELTEQPENPSSHLLQSWVRQIPSSWS